MGSVIEWEHEYAQDWQLNNWPFSQLVSMATKHLGSQKLQDPETSILELGSGTANNYPFFKSHGSKFIGIELSKSAIEYSIRRFSELANTLILENFLNFEYKPESFDLIYDRAAVFLNKSEDLAVLVKRIYDFLKPGGFYFGIEWYGEKSSDFVPGKTRDQEFSSGQFAGLGTVHFTSRDEINALFKKFQFVELKSIEIEEGLSDNSVHVLQLYTFAVQKPAL